jgi:stress up-regulated protein Nod 19
VLLLALLVPGTAAARVQTLHMRYGPIVLQPAELKGQPTRVKTPQVRGFVTRVHAYIADARGRRFAPDQVMLHHAVFRRDVRPRYDPDCQSRRETEPFYATGEEDETLRLPTGYGLRVSPHDHWRIRWMLMNHTNSRFKVFLRYDVRVETSPRIVPVLPLWMRVVSCRDEYFDVPGDGGPGSVFTQSRQVVAQRTGRIVVATGHLHGGAVGLTLSEPRCAGRTLLSARPLFRSGAPQPHDGPVHVTSFSSPVGIPIFRGQALGLAATYDNSVRHDDVMGTLHLYVARERPRAFDCGPLPVGSEG